MITLEPYAGALGAIISNVDLAAPLEMEDIAAIKQALLDYEVLFFRDQAMLPQHHASLADAFGQAQCHEAYPHVDGFPQLTILDNDEANPSKIECWHADMTFRPCPPLGSILHGIIIPPKGGDTLFSSMTVAYENLSNQMQHFLSGLTAIHDFSYGFKESLEEPGGRERLSQMVIDNPPVEHPVVRTHPESGKKCIFVNRLFTVAIKELKPEESKILLEFLYDHIITPEFTCRFRWLPNSIAFWDNRVTQHKPVNDYWPQRRKMQRITIDDGQRPF